MSRYSDKRAKAVCVHPDCVLPAVKLCLVDGQPDWFCDEHAEDLR